MEKIEDFSKLLLSRRKVDYDWVKPQRQFSSKQKADIVRYIQSYLMSQEGLDKFDITTSLYYKWSRQLEVGINASLRNSKPIKPMELRQLEKENRQLKEDYFKSSHLENYGKKMFDFRGMRKIYQVDLSNKQEVAQFAE